MSERWQECPTCHGRGDYKDPVLFRTINCPRCGGTGFDGDVNIHDYRERVCDTETEYFKEQDNLNRR
jgi:DnaJ-class molecular chaperone